MGRIREKHPFPVSVKGTERENDMYVVAFDKGHSEIDKLFSIYQQFWYIYRKESTDRYFESF